MRVKLLFTRGERATIDVGVVVLRPLLVYRRHVFAWVDTGPGIPTYVESEATWVESESF